MSGRLRLTGTGDHMRELNGEVFKVKQSRSGELGIGRRLSELRRLGGLTQIQMAKRLGMTRNAVSGVENRDDLNISTLRRYVEALGASLHVDARFDRNSSLVSTLRDVFDGEFSSDDQFVLPIFEDEKHLPSRDFVLSIRPKYSQKIEQCEKTVELRRRFPIDVPNGTLAFIYTTSPRRALTGVARISSVEKMPVDEIWKTFSHTAGIDRDSFDSYFSGLDSGFGIVFSKARKLQRTLELDELRGQFGFRPPQSFLYAKPVLRQFLRHECADLVD